METRRIYSGKNEQYSTFYVAYGFVVVLVARVETKVKGSSLPFSIDDVIFFRGFLAEKAI